jgi:hypothetical protein
MYVVTIFQVTSRIALCSLYQNLPLDVVLSRFHPRQVIILCFSDFHVQKLYVCLFAALLSNNRNPYEYFSRGYKITWITPLNSSRYLHSLVQDVLVLALGCWRFWLPEPALPFGSAFLTWHRSRCQTVSSLLCPQRSCVQIRPWHLPST